ncbi:hypothetical protein GH810_04220 [Acetobacterium paludosum]|uniref:Uncharacterized protein n=1 Tax=Acetobacterium paludosum TaxID=52693 RepID=A0A923KNW0_9FIRM|nr:hypothetical protein [Acetobacterium paludosum]MBC3887509.1 hypothetical protein [Acetobacterium paludosum]
MKLKLWQKNLLSMLIIVVGGLTLFLVAFLFAALVMRVWDMIIFSLVNKDSDNFGRILSINDIIYLIIILLVSWLVFKSKLNDLVKATFLTMPLMVVLMEVGILFNQQSEWVVLLIGSVIVAASLYYLYKTKRPWLYYCAILFVTAVVLFISLSGMEI